MKHLALGSAAVLAALAAAQPATAQIDNRIASGSSKGLSWVAQNRIVGMTSTATVAGGGNPQYFANNPRYNGVVTLIMEYNGVGAFICTGSLVNRNSVVTAAHCVSDGFGTKGPDRVRAYFTNSSDPDLVRFGAGFDPVAGVTAIDVSYVHVNPGYTGEVIDQNDIAVLKLASNAPSYARQYDFAFGDDLFGERFNVVGNGRRSDVGGAVGANLGTGRMRQGENIYDYRWGDDAFGGFFTDVVGGENFFGTAEIAHSWVSDFDSGLSVNDMSCRIAAAVGAPGFGCQLGVGEREVGIAGGDSGGPGFLDGRLASVNSYGLTFGTGFGDVDGLLNSSWGEYSGYVPVYIHEDWLKSVVPEPATWAMMIAGFGFVGAALRRRRSMATA